MTIICNLLISLAQLPRLHFVLSSLVSNILWRLLNKKRSLRWYIRMHFPAAKPANDVTEKRDDACSIADKHCLGWESAVVSFNATTATLARF